MSFLKRKGVPASQTFFVRIRSTREGSNEQYEFWCANETSTYWISRSGVIFPKHQFERVSGPGFEG